MVGEAFFFYFPTFTPKTRGAGMQCGGVQMGSYHGVFLDDSSGVAVVDVNRPAVVTLFGGAYGDI